MKSEWNQYKKSKIRDVYMQVSALDVKREPWIIIIEEKLYRLGELYEEGDSKEIF